jgi:hypothetical protein
MHWSGQNMKNRFGTESRFGIKSTNSFLMDCWTNGNGDENRVRRGG